MALKNADGKLPIDLVDKSKKSASAAAAKKIRQRLAEAAAQSEQEEEQQRRQRSAGERPAPTADHWKSLGFPNGELFRALHHTRDRHVIETTVTTQVITINQLALIASAKRALESWLLRSDRPYVVLFEDDALPASANVPDLLQRK